MGWVEGSWPDKGFGVDMGLRVLLILMTMRA